MDELTKKKIDAILNEASVFPNKARKPREIRERDLIEWYEKSEEVNELYNLYGMDLAECSSPCLDNYLDMGLFRKQRHDINAFFYPRDSRYPVDYTTIMRDKCVFDGVFSKVLEKKNMVKNVAILKNRHFYSVDDVNREIPLNSLADFFNSIGNCRLAVKPAFGTGGGHIRIIDVSDGKIIDGECEYDPNTWISHMMDRDTTLLFQEYIYQHPFYAAFNQESCNTVRVVSFNTGDDVELLPITLRYGDAGANVDNLSAGGWLLGIDQEGKLKDFTVNKIKKQIKHGLSNAGAVLPFYEEIRLLAIKCHRQIPEIFTIGWDFAVTANGPILIEGNDGWDPDVTQLVHGGVRDIWNKMIKRREEYYL